MKHDPESWARSTRIKKGVEPMPYVKITKSVAQTYGFPNSNTVTRDLCIHVADLRDHDLVGVFKAYTSRLNGSNERLLELRGRQLWTDEKLWNLRDRLKRLIPLLRCHLLAIEQEIAKRPSLNLNPEGVSP